MQSPQTRLCQHAWSLLALTDNFVDTTDAPSLAPASIETQVSPPTVQLGQPFFLEVKLKHPAHFRVELLAPPNSPRFDILSKTQGRDDGPEESTSTFSIQMAAFELGNLELPALSFAITASGQTETLTVPGKTISVLTSREEAPSGLEDVRPPAPVFVPDYAVLYGVAAALALALAFVLVWKWFRQRKKEMPAAALAKPLAQRAREALHALRAQALPSQGKTREYYFMLSEIVRGYVGELHQLDALECTTTELMASLGRLPSTQIPLDAFARFSHEADFIKYAKGNADVAKCEADLAFAYQLIDKTAPTHELSTRHVQPSLP